ncbi:hypothetical protein [Bradyrhizobium sp. Gha]|uniref:hypothetical protein n=1 Tax=Bradyrhizobium sp. Gha TaxID=1855318 RepID=UPI0008EDFAFC|nr:hypothetical protein [Bradyrhizobium sp. Gha]SFI40057.1 hypothetical protein SAMN05216525_10876 [Bradyrhizobium sp. Gha]
MSDIEMAFTNKDAVSNARYGLGCAIEGTFAVWLFSHGNEYGQAGIWLAYFLLAATATCLLVGFCWYFLWASERRIAQWYLASMTSLVGIACLILDRLFDFGFGSWDVALAFGLLYFVAAYGVWRLVRRSTAGCFNLLLSAVSQLGAAWRGQQRS